MKIDDGVWLQSACADCACDEPTGGILVKSEIHLKALERSIELGLLTDAEVDDRRAVGRLVADVFAQAIKKGSASGPDRTILKATIACSRSHRIDDATADPMTSAASSLRLRCPGLGAGYAPKHVR